MKTPQSILIALGVVVVVGLGGYLWTALSPQGSSSSNVNNKNTNSVSAGWLKPVIGDYGQATTSAAEDPRAITAGYWNLESGRVYLQILNSDGKSLDEQSNALKNSNENDVRNSATTVNGFDGNMIVTINNATNIEYTRTYVINNSYLYEFSIETTAESADQKLYTEYQTALSKLTFEN